MQNYLRNKPTFNELINYIEIERPKIKYPDRSATFLRNSHYLSQFDGNLFDLEEQQKNIAKAQLRETEIRNLAQTQGTASLLRGDAAQEQNRRTTAEATRPRGRPPRKSTQTEPETAPETKTGETQTGDPLMYGQNPLLFDMTADDKTDETMEEIDTVMETARIAEEKKNRIQ